MNIASTLDKLETEYWRALRQQAPNHEFEEQYRCHELRSSFRGLSRSQQRDFGYYLAGGRAEPCYKNFLPTKSRFQCRPPSLECWYWLWDTHGIQTFSPEFFRDCEAVKQIKEFTNLTIKMWVEDCLSGLLRNYEVKSYCADMPPWVWRAFVGQMKKQATLTFQLQDLE